MALSLRKPPKIKRKGYRKLQQNHSRDNGNYTLFTDDHDDAANDELWQETVLDASVPRNRLRNKTDQNREDIKSIKDNRASQSFLSYKIQPDDTLQGIALKYGSTVAEIKRFNNLIRDQDAFALRELRIPAREHSVLFEIFSNADTTNAESNNSKTFHISIGQMLRKNEKEEPSLFLQEMDRDIERMVENTQIKSTSSLEKEIALSSPRIQPLTNKSYDGANWGINWFNLLIALLIISVLTPVVMYGLYFVTVVQNRNETISDHTNEIDS